MGVVGDTASLTALCVLPDERRAVCGWLCPAGPQLAAGHRRRPAAQRSMREASVHPGWLHADSSRQVTGTWLFGVEGQGGFPWGTAQPPMSVQPTASWLPAARGTCKP